MQPVFGLEEIWKDRIPGTNEIPKGETPWQVVSSIKGIGLTVMLSNKARNVQKSLKRKT